MGMRRVELGLASICDVAFAFNFDAWATIQKQGLLTRRSQRAQRGPEKRDCGNYFMAFDDMDARISHVQYT
jgi:hypothetical protein